MKRVICIGEGGKSMNVSVGGCLKQNMASLREKRRVKIEGWAMIKGV